VYVPVPSRLLGAETAGVGVARGAHVANAECAAIEQAKFILCWQPKGMAGVSQARH
jgi:hypothetical protein